MTEKIKNFLIETQEEKTFIDISDMNLFEAAKTAVLYSTKLFIKYPDKKICWSVKDEETKKLISSLMLKNMEFEIKEKQRNDKVFAIK